MTETGRGKLQMTSEEVDVFLAAGRRVQVATLDGGGRVDLVPMSYLLWEGRMALWTDPGSKKVRNLRSNPAIVCLVEAGDSFAELRAVQLRGHAELIDDVEVSRQAGELLSARYRTDPLDEEARAETAALASKRVVVVVHPERIVSWDHRKQRGVTRADAGH